LINNTNKRSLMYL